ncbi:MAG: ATP-binding cassette domain-containing protein [Nitrosopumilales archaeon]|jgi:ABC-2 type transport system ATP-binding protein|nr:ATP-binding cassette domain-containing protein [Nitrosopumilales archaeon]MRN61204.1 ATP-binding cassette domain-containing protein [Nitrosopumilales archaeon]MRN68959.1 ATP-binding cassette domain-containing protein [Nitrosopumilales archaeon]
MLAVEAVQVYKLYKGSNYAALNNVSVDVEPGQIFTLLGRNGAGKTTFVRICATQLAPTKGIVRVLGYDILKEAGKIRNLISVVPQESRPLRALTPWDHVYNWLQIRGESKYDAKKKTEKILHKLELYEAKDTPAMNLSGGMKQKILVAMAMATDAQLLFLDEPTIGLDPVSRRQVWSAIKDWKNEGKSILLTTHYMDEAEMLSDSIVIIDKGRVIADGTMRDLRKIIPQNIRIDIAKDSMDIELLKSYGSVVDTGTGTLRVFTFESTIKEISDFAIKKNLSFTVSPITLDDVFVSLVGKNTPDTEDDHRNTSINYDNGN